MTVAFAARPPIPSHPYDVIIIGAGVNGVAIARECALGGQRVLLLEQNDFASGTSSRATRIIHGGLRYLEHGELGLVRESLRERELLLRTKPNLVQRLNFILAIPRHNNLFSLRSPLALRAGMGFYRAISGRRKNVTTAKEDVARLERSQDSGTRWTVLDYEDAQCEFPERLIADWLVEALAAGAVARNHAEVLNVDVSNGRAVGVRTRDCFTGEESRFCATWIINATGPWADRVTVSSQIKTPRMIGGVRGSHIILPRFPSAPHSAIYAEAMDGRPMFIIPWNGQTLVGTTEVADSADPAHSGPSSAEVEYLLQSFLRIFPQSTFKSADIIACYAGVRPLPFSSDQDASVTTRKHFLHDHANDGARGLVSVIGGKLTTATSLARECARKIGVTPSAPQPAVIAQVDTARDHAELTSPDSAQAVRDWHGASAARILASAADDPALAETLCPHSPHVVAEAVYAVRNELAVTLGDVLLRRVPVALGSCWSSECSRTASQRIGSALSWSETQVEQAREDFDAERSAFLMKPSHLT